MEFKAVKEVAHEEKSVQEVENMLLEQVQQQQPAPVPEAPKEEAPKPTPEVDLDDTVVLTHINKKHNKAFTTLDELLTPKIVEAELPEDVSAYYKYKKETGRSISDYMKTQRDYSKEDPKKVIAEYIAVNNPEFDESDIQYELNKFVVDELDDERDAQSKKIAMKKELSNALHYFNKQKEQYKIPLESSSPLVPEEEREQYEAYRKKVSESKTELEKGKVLSDYFVQKSTELFDNPDFKGFDFNVGDKKITFSPSDTEKMKQTQMNVGNFVNSHLTEEGYIKDAAAYHKALAIAMNPDLFAKHFYEQGKADLASAQAISSKNINMGNVRNAPDLQVKQEGLKVTAVDDSHGSGLKIRSPKNK